MEQTELKNFLVAIFLAVVILFCWQFFIEKPKEKKYNNELVQFKKQQAEFEQKRIQGHPKHRPGQQRQQQFQPRRQVLQPTELLPQHSLVWVSVLDTDIGDREQQQPEVKPQQNLPKAGQGIQQHPAELQIAAKRQGNRAQLKVRRPLSRATNMPVKERPRHQQTSQSGEEKMAICNRRFDLFERGQ